ncbi:MAG TPA: ribonuclease III [Terriglobales bacterium]|nr:ribonuclease III [Terriglobales bacterium]
MKETSADIELLQQTLGHRFKDRALLERALTHSSHANESAMEDAQSLPVVFDNEQMEFLGDAVLGFVTSLTLYQRYPNFSEGHLSKLRAHLVSARHLIQVARKIGLGNHLRLGRGEERTGGRQKSALLVDALEAVIAAVYLDGGLEPAKDFILRCIVGPELDQIDRDPQKALEVSDQKSALQEWLQATGRPQPSYHVVQEAGPDHQKVFTVELKVLLDRSSQQIHISRGQGPTKKKAEQMAAQDALKALKESDGSAR